MKTKNTETIGIIGGGLGGLASACTLAARGYKVVLFEANPWLGGKAAELNEQGFRFDMGPTILTLPSVLRRIFEEAGRHMDDYLKMVRLDPQWRSFFGDGTTLDLVSDETAMAQNLDRFAPGGKVSAGYRKFQGLSKRLHDISQRFFFYKSIGGLNDMFNAWNTFSASTLSDVLAMRMGRSVASTIRSHVPDERVAQMLDHYTQYVGSSPLNSPAVLCGIGHMQSDEGVWYPIGGTRAVPLALKKLAEELGAQFRPNTQIRRIIVEKKRVTGVETASGERIELAAVVSNMDAVRTHRELIGGETGRRFDARRTY